MFAQRALATDWKDTAPAEAMLVNLLMLPRNLQRQVLSACLATKSLREMLDCLPVPLHCVAVSSAASDGNLEFQWDSPNLQLGG
eukprot:jgi/Ulvmu1/11156/UM071_0040.1